MRCLGRAGLLILCLLLARITPISAQSNPQSSELPIYKQASAPIEERVQDLLGRMTLEEKVRQLDLYSGAAALVDKQSDSTHAARKVARLAKEVSAPPLSGMHRQ